MTLVMVLNGRQKKWLIPCFVAFDTFLEEGNMIPSMAERVVGAKTTAVPPVLQGHSSRT